LAEGGKAGMHPTGDMSFPVPEDLRKAGARTGSNPCELTCQVCHTAHGATHEHLVVLGTASNELCVTCHAQMRPGMFIEGSPTEHPLSPVVDRAQAAAVAEMRTQLGPGNHLICLSCHQMHHANGQLFLLAENLAGGTMCLRCHADRCCMLGTSHDLRQKFPAERDRLGLTADTGGPCSACHLFHEYARPPESSTLDPSGQCSTCHQAGRPAETKALGPANHTPVGCTKCHDPHSEQYGQYLRNVAHAVCTDCHAAQAGLCGGPHDVELASANWPSASAATGDACLTCHRPHARDDAGRFRAGYAANANAGEGACLPCHMPVEPGGDLALLHPRDATNLAASELPLESAAHGKLVSCRTCHDPHRGRSPDAALLRIVAATPTSAELCITCHAEAANIQAIGHAGQVLWAAGLDARACGPCHVTHGRADAVEPHLMWPVQLADPTEATPPARAADRHCLACHRPDGPAPPPAIATHPAAEMFNPASPDDADFLPLFNAQGEVDPRGSIACRTCHLTHGRASPAPVPPGLGTLSERELRARQWHIRSLGPQSICTTCHGFDALRRFMYFHDAARRGGPIASR
jgi:predicted CXXCH cytochrome family protein